MLLTTSGLAPALVIQHALSPSLNKMKTKHVKHDTSETKSGADSYNYVTWGSFLDMCVGIGGIGAFDCGGAEHVSLGCGVLACTHACYLGICVRVLLL